jgi:nicotinamidase-related amidase
MMLMPMKTTESLQFHPLQSLISNSSNSSSGPAGAAALAKPQRGIGCRGLSALILVTALVSVAGFSAELSPTTRTYQNRLTPIKNPRPLLADHPEWVEPIRETNRFEAPVLVADAAADLEVRAWRFSYNARGIIEMPNHLRANQTAIIVVHPWGIDDNHGWRTPEPAGVADFCTPRKNALSYEHTKRVIDPFLKQLRGKIRHVLYSEPGAEDPIRKKLYRSVRGRPTNAEREQGRQELAVKLNSFPYRGEPLPAELKLTANTPVVDYFKQFPGLDAGDRYNGSGFWKLPIPVVDAIEVFPDDVVIYDDEGYPVLRDFLRLGGIRHILLTGYATDMCYARTCAGYENLSKDFNVFLVGDATLATFPAHDTPRFATSAHIAFASLNQLVTQISWIEYRGTGTTKE